MKKKHFVPIVQGLYFIITGIWPIVHIESFMQITGYKTDIWLVKTVGLLILPYSILCFYTVINTKRNAAIAIVNIMCCLGLAWIDLYYYLKDTISWVYLIDCALEMIFSAYWLFYLNYSKRTYRP
ncbi:hypothetical protein [Chryseobacterium culicis]|uniref:hypothetical protein n=1 Tax=Chryseobacterium culicis TaxID=680127 RepID=UPI0028A243D6|nr:hypothetical protein [Chryseobacterium culicis]